MAAARFNFWGIILHERMSRKQHIEHIRIKIAKTIGIAYWLNSMYPSAILLKLYNTLATPHLHYCLLCWGHQAARMLTRSPRRNHFTPVLRELYWLRISDRIIFKILILTHNVFHGVAPVYLCELITKCEQATVRTRRAQDCFLLAIPLLVRHVQPVFFSDHLYMLL